MIPRFLGSPAILAIVFILGSGSPLLAQLTPTTEPAPTGTIATHPYWRGSILAGRPTASFELSQPAIDFKITGTAAGDSHPRTMVRTGTDPNELYWVDNVHTCLPEHPCLAGQTRALSIPMNLWRGTATHDPDLRYHGITGIWEPTETYDNSPVTYASSVAVSAFDGLVTFPGRPAGKDQTKVTFTVPVTLRLSVHVSEEYLPPGTGVCNYSCENTVPRQRTVWWDTAATLTASVNADYNSALKRWEYTIDEGHMQTYTVPVVGAKKRR